MSAPETFGELKHIGPLDTEKQRADAIRHARGWMYEIADGCSASPELFKLIAEHDIKVAELGDWSADGGAERLLQGGVARLVARWRENPGAHQAALDEIIDTPVAVEFLEAAHFPLGEYVGRRIASSTNRP
jgi:hypothetical protein